MPCNLVNVAAPNNKNKAQFSAGQRLNTWASDRVLCAGVFDPFTTNLSAGQFMSKDVQKNPAKPSSGVTSACLYTGKPLSRSPSHMQKHAHVSDVRRENHLLDERDGNKETRRQITEMNRNFFISVENDLKKLFGVRSVMVSVHCGVPARFTTATYLRVVNVETNQLIFSLQTAKAQRRCTRL